MAHWMSVTFTDELASIRHAANRRSAGQSHVIESMSYKHENTSSEETKKSEIPIGKFKSLGALEFFVSV